MNIIEQLVEKLHNERFCRDCDDWRRYGGTEAGYTSPEDCEHKDDIRAAVRAALMLAIDQCDPTCSAPICSNAGHIAWFNIKQRIKTLAEMAER